MLRRLVYLFPLLIGLALAAIIAAGLYAEQERHAQASRLKVVSKLSTIQSGFENGLNTRLHLAGALKSFIMLNPELEQEAFASLAKGLIEGGSGVRFIELARGNAISHIYPEDESERMIGRQLLLDFPVDIRDLTLRAMQSRQGHISTPLTVIEGGEAIISVTPVYLADGGLPGSSTYWGMIVMLIDVKTLYREAGIGTNVTDIDIAIREPGDVHGQSRMLYGKDRVFSMSPVIMNTPIPGGYWQVAAVPGKGWSVSPHQGFILYGGGIATVTLTALLLVMLTVLLRHLSEREQYRQLIQRAKSIILRTDMDGNITFCNDYGELFFGYDSGELTGKSLIGTLITEASVGGKSVKRYVDQLLRNPAAHPFNETINVRKNGEMVWVAWANEAVMGRDGTMVELLCVGTDITDRKLMEESLKSNERQYRLLAENVSDIILGMDAGLHITYVSPSDEAVRGFKRYEVLGRPIGDFLTPQSERALEDAMFGLSSQMSLESSPPSTTVDMEFTCANDGTVWLETRIGLLLNENDDIIGVQGVARDITDRKRAEALRDDVERMARHDLKTPLGAVVGLPDEIRRMGKLNPTQDGMLETIENAGETMLQLINRSLDLFKMECGTYVLERKNVDVLSIIECIKNDVRTIFREKGVSLGIDTQNSLSDGTFPAMVEEDLFRSMLSNLMVNALQASPNGGAVSIFLACDKVISITIRNKGEVLPGLRDIFFDKYASGDGTGSGLGTYSARLIARTHGGDITVDTCAPGETCVIITLPV
ncbi:MAG: PAS domain S-box protein [Pseudodesulfovibrio sp.]